MEQMTSICDMVGQYMQKKEEDKRITEDQAAKDRYWKILICYDEDDDERSSIPLKDIIISGLPPCVAITPVLLTKEPVNSLIMEDEHLDTILATKSDEVIKSSIENLVPIPSESEGIPDKMCDASPPDSELVSLEEIKDFHTEDGEIKDDILCEKISKINLLIAKIKAINSNPPPSSDFVTKSPSTFLNFFLEETNTFDNSIPESETFCFDLEENSSGSTTTRSDYSLPDYEAFYLDDDYIEEKSSGSTTTHADFSQYDSFNFDLLINLFPPADRSDFYHKEFAGELAHIISPSEYNHFYFKIEPELGNFTMDVVEDIFDNPTREPRVHIQPLMWWKTSPLMCLTFCPPIPPFIWISTSFLLIMISDTTLDVLLLSGDRNKIYDPGICIEVESIRFLATFSLVIDTLLPFSSKNEDKVFNHSVLASEEKSPPSSSHRGFKASKIFHHKSPMLIHGETLLICVFIIPFVSPLDKASRLSRIFEASRSRGFVMRSQELQILSFIWEIQCPNLID
ncbi:hypothetical protein Tco_0059187 [Tanacetum coccineum]